MSQLLGGLTKCTFLFLSSPAPFTMFSFYNVFVHDCLLNVQHCVGRVGGSVKRAVKFICFKGNPVTSIKMT